MLPDIPCLNQRWSGSHNSILQPAFYAQVSGGTMGLAKLEVPSLEQLSNAHAQPNPDLSICIVSWNCCDYLRALLSSIEVEGDKLALEVIVIDNGSTDDSASMVMAEYPQVKLIRNFYHQGLARANNQAAENARGNLLLFLNDDTVIPPGALTKLLGFFEQHPDVAGVMPRTVSPNGRANETVRKTPEVRAMLHRILFLRWTTIFRSAEREFRQVNFDLKQSSYVEQVTGAAMAVRKGEFLSVGGYDEGFEWGLEGLDLSVRLGQVGRLYYLAEAEIIHWGGVATKLDKAYTYRGRECAHVYYLRKHFGPWTARLYKILTTLDMPLRVGLLMLNWLGRKLSGSSEKASRNYSRLAAAAQFLFRGMPHYWAS
jgi:N-acetylglucosaminyl-diphospho-decaprenol L-rhamnosyltransferase